MRSRPLIKIPIYAATLVAILLITLYSLPKNNESSVTPVRFMTFNIRFDNPNDGGNAWANRKEMVCTLIDDYRCDFIGMQEVLPSQMDDILIEVTRYKSIFRTREVNPDEGEASPILYDGSKWSVLESGTFWLSDTPYETGSNTWDAACNRIATWGKFRNLENKRTLFVFNTHLDHVSQKAREKSADLILEKIFILAEGSPVVFMGDLNVEEDNPVYQSIIFSQQYVDAYRSIHSESTEKDLTFNGWQAGKGISRIDYIFTTGEFRIKNARVINTMWNGRYPSDHFPVLVEAEF